MSWLDKLAPQGPPRTTVYQCEDGHQIVQSEGAYTPRFLTCPMTVSFDITFRLDGGIDHSNQSCGKPLKELLPPAPPPRSAKTLWQRLLEQEERCD